MGCHVRVDVVNVVAIMCLRMSALLYHFREVAAVLRST